MGKRKKNAEIKPGTIIKVPFGEYHTYARALNYSDYAFYDFKGKEDMTNLNMIISKPILFRAVVNSRGLIEGFWHVVGEIPLESDLQHSIYYIAGPVDPNEYRIVEDNDFRNATKEECIGLEPHAVWDPIHIEQRLKDHYAGLENMSIKMLDPLENYKRKK